MSAEKATGKAIYIVIYIEVIYVGALFSRMINRCWYGKRKSKKNLKLFTWGLPWGSSS